MIPRWIHSVLFAGALVACSSKSAPVPTLSGIEPDTVVSGQRSRVSILGEHFRPRIFGDYDDPKGSRVDLGFRVSLDAHQLADIEFVGPTQLRATVPTGLMQRTYDVIVTDPMGRKASLSGAFEVVAATIDATPGDALPPGDAAPEGSIDTAAPDDGASDGSSVPLATSSLVQAFEDEQVRCVDDRGRPAGADIPLVDSDDLKFVDGAVTLAGAGASTRAWAGTGPWVTVIFDINACGHENPVNARDADWQWAGLLIRGAKLDQGRLVLAKGSTNADMNLLDVGSNGAFEREVARPDDSQLSSHPQILDSVNAAKRLILQLGLQ